MPADRSFWRMPSFKKLTRIFYSAMCKDFQAFKVGFLFLTTEIVENVWFLFCQFVLTNPCHKISPVSSNSKLFTIFSSPSAGWRLFQFYQLFILWSPIESSIRFFCWPVSCLDSRRPDQSRHFCDVLDARHDDSHSGLFSNRPLVLLLMGAPFDEVSGVTVDLEHLKLVFFLFPALLFVTMRSWCFQVFLTDLYTDRVPVESWRKTKTSEKQKINGVFGTQLVLRFSISTSSTVNQDLGFICEPDTTRLQKSEEEETYLDATPHLAIRMVAAKYYNFCSYARFCGILAFPTYL